MFKQQEMENMQQHKTQILLLCTFGLIFFSGLSFTFVIPGLKGFDFISSAITLAVYFALAGLVSAVLSNKVWLIFL